MIKKFCSILKIDLISIKYKNIWTTFTYVFCLGYLFRLVSDSSTIYPSLQEEKCLGTPLPKPRLPLLNSCKQKALPDTFTGSRDKPSCLSIDTLLESMSSDSSSGESASKNSKTEILVLLCYSRTPEPKYLILYLQHQLLISIFNNYIVLFPFPSFLLYSTYTLNAYYIPGTVLGKDLMVHSTDACGVSFLVRRYTIKQVIVFFNTK